MFDVGFSELLLIALVALVVLGPQRLPEVARGAGRMLGRLRNFVANVKQDLDRELHTHELAELRRLKDELEQTRRTFEESSQRMLNSIGTAEAAPSPAQTPGVSLPPPANPSPETGKRPPSRRPKKSKHGQAKKKKRRTRR